MKKNSRQILISWEEKEDLNISPNILTAMLLHVVLSEASIITAKYENISITGQEYGMSIDKILNDFRNAKQLLQEIINSGVKTKEEIIELLIEDLEE